MLPFVFLMPPKVRLKVIDSRPRVWAECKAARPDGFRGEVTAAAELGMEEGLGAGGRQCPYMGCRHHVLSEQALEAWGPEEQDALVEQLKGMTESCVLDFERADLSVEQVAKYLNLSVAEVKKAEGSGMRKVRKHFE